MPAPGRWTGTMGVVLMPRRPPRIRPRVPLILVSPLIRLEIQKAGEDLERIVVRRNGLHHYNVSIHTRPAKRELKPGGSRSGKLREGAEP